MLHSALTCPSNENAQHLKSRHPFHIPAAQQLISSSDDKIGSGWNADKLECTTRLRTSLPDPPSWNGTAENSVQ